MKYTVEPNAKIGLLFMALKEHGATHIKITFYGGGDSGACEEAHALPLHEYSNYYPEIDYEMVQDLGQLVNPCIQEYDWWNNEGGSGDITIDLDDLSYDVSYEIAGEDTADYDVDENGDIDYDSAEPNHEYSQYSSTGTLKLD